MSRSDAARTYYEAIDADEYDRLADLLAPSFVHVRPDRTLEGRDRFVRFMRDERPLTDTTHEVRSVTAEGNRVVVEGTLYRGDGSTFFRFADVHEFDDGGIAQIRTYSA